MIFDRRIIYSSASRTGAGTGTGTDRDRKYLNAIVVGGGDHQRLAVNEVHSGDTASCHGQGTWQSTVQIGEGTGNSPRVKSGGDGGLLPWASSREWSSLRSALSLPPPPRCQRWILPSPEPEASSGYCVAMASVRKVREVTAPVWRKLNST